MAFAVVIIVRLALATIRVLTAAALAAGDRIVVVAIVIADATHGQRAGNRLLRDGIEIERSDIRRGLGDAGAVVGFGHRRESEGSKANKAGERDDGCEQEQ